MKKTKRNRGRAEKALEGAESRLDPDVKGAEEDVGGEAPAEADPAKAEACVAEAAAEPVDPVEELQAKVETLEDSILRAKADYQNLVRRSAGERADAVRYANAELMRSLLGVLDDFERSFVAADNSEDLASVVEGVRLVHENFLNALRAHGLEPIEALHRPFDPKVFLAVHPQ